MIVAELYPVVFKDKYERSSVEVEKSNYTWDSHMLSCNVRTFQGKGVIPTFIVYVIKG